MMRRTKLLMAAATAVTIAVAAGGYALASGGFSSVTFNGCLAGGKLGQVQVTRTPSCSASATPVQWAGQAVTGSPSPSPTPTSPSPTPTSPSPTPTGTGGCSGSGDNFICGPYTDPGVAPNNGFNLYDETNCWGHPGCGYQISAPDPSGSTATPWTVTATEAPGNTAVMSYPQEQELTNDWCGTGWGNCNHDTTISQLTSLSSSYGETMPHNPGTIAQAAYDIWTNYPSDIMVWLDNVNRGDGGATQIGTAVIGGQHFTVYRNGGTGGEIIFSLDGAGGTGTFAQQSSGTVDLLAVLQWVQANVDSSLSAIGQIDFGWEICSTGGSAETFTVNSYSLTGG